MAGWSPEVNDIFLKALEVEPEAARIRFLEKECRGNAQLRGQVEQLLSASARAGSFLESPPTDVAAAIGTMEAPEPIPESLGGVIGPYKLLERIGEGGFGSVYMAEQREPVQRRVALKIIKLGMDTKQVIARFEAERQALAMMDHPNIARVLDAGATDTGRPYFVMELVRGISITKFCDQDHLTIRQRLELFTHVCHAVQHAHQKGIIHRDIKPSNVLVTMHDDKAVPKVIDFGVAKATHMRLTDKTLFTEFCQLLGTPAYMSPEQAQMSGLDIDTRSDIYSLGVLLYELLTGTTPFDHRTLLAAGYDEMRRLIREVEPPRPSTRISTLAVPARPTGSGSAADDSGGQPLPDNRGADRSSSAAAIARHRHTEPAALGRLLRGDLDWIVMKCLEKDRTRRYETASGLATDITRHLSGEPVLAAPPSRIYRLRKVLRRYRVPVTFAATIALLLVGATAVSLSLWHRADANATRAEANAAATARQAEETELAATLLTDLIGKTDPAETRIPNEVMRQRLDDFAASFEPKLAGHPDVEARVRLALGSAYNDIGALDQAESHQARALAIYRELYGSEHPKVATAMHAGACLLGARRDFAGAEAMHREALAMRRRLLGDVHPDVSTSLMDLGATLRQLGNYAESEAALRESLTIVQKLYGPEDRRATDTLQLLFKTLRNSGRTDEAVIVGRRSLALQRKTYGDQHVSTARMLTLLGATLAVRGQGDEGLAMAREGVDILERAYPDGAPGLAFAYERLAEALCSLGRPEEALPKYEAALAIFQRAFKGDSPTVADSLDRVACCLSGNLGRPAEALPKCEAALEMRERLFKGDHPHVAISLGVVGGVLQRLGQPQDALPKHEAALAMSQRLFPGDHPHVAVNLQLLAQCLEALGRPQEALPKYEAALEMGQRLFPGDHPDSLHRLAHCLEKLGRPQEALPKFQAALEMNQRLLRGDHADVAKSLNCVANCLQTLGRSEEAAAKYEAALQMYRRLLPAGDLGIAGAIAPLALVLLDQQDFAKAEPLLRECLAIRREKLPPDHWLRFNTMSALGGALAGQGALLVESDRTGATAKLEEAEALLLDGYAGVHTGLKDNAGVPPEMRELRIHQALERIVKLYETWDDAEPDSGYAEKATEWRATLDADDETPRPGPAP